MLKKWLCVILALLLLAGCGAKETAAPEDDAAAVESGEIAGEDGGETDSEAGGQGSEPGEPYVYNPHLTVPLVAADVPEEYWQALHCLCDALRAGEDTFACPSQEAYRWATDQVTLNHLFPAACTRVTPVEDGFADGVGRVHYEMPAEDFVARQAQFEADVAALLNKVLRNCDTDFEKALKLYNYMSLNFLYEYDFVPDKGDGSVFVTFHSREGQCVDLAGLYAFLLTQAGVEAVDLGCFAENMDHEWVYLVLDGAGYHSDVTWGLREPGEPLDLTYFLMTGEMRANSGCPVDDLTVPLLPRFWVSFSASRFPADTETLCFPAGSHLTRLDEAADTAYYMLSGKETGVYYGG